MAPRGSMKPKYGVDADLEIARLKHKIDGLHLENHSLRAFCIEQHKELELLKSRTGWDQFNDSLITLGNHRISDAINALQKLRQPYEEQVRSTAQNRNFDVDSVTGNKRRSTIPSSATAPDIRHLELGRPLKRVDSVAALAAKFTSLFKRNKNSTAKEKGKKDHIAESDTNVAKERAWGVIAEWEEQKKLAKAKEEYEHRLAEERTLRHKREPKIGGEHEQVIKGWKLEKAQEEYKKSSEKVKVKPAIPARNPARKSSSKNLNGHHASTKESRQVEQELLAAMERDYLASYTIDNNRSTRSLNWPEGRTITGSIFEGPQLLPQPPVMNQTTQHPQPPQPNRPAPSIPHKSRPRQSKPPLLPPAGNTDDVFALSRPATAFAAADNQPIRRLRHRRSAPSPTPRFVAHRPASPSPGGNDPMPETPVPGWLKKWDEKRMK